MVLESVSGMRQQIQGEGPHYIKVQNRVHHFVCSILFKEFNYYLIKKSQGTMWLVNRRGGCCTDKQLIEYMD